MHPAHERDNLADRKGEAEPGGPLAGGRWLGLFGGSFGCLLVFNWGVAATFQPTICRTQTLVTKGTQATADHAGIPATV